MANWRKQSGLAYLKERETGSSDIKLVGVTTGYDLVHTITFDANELKTGDIIDLFVGWEGVFAGGTAVAARINLGDVDGITTRFSSATVSSSGTRGYFLQKKLFVVSPTVISVSDDQVFTGLGGSSSAILDIPVDITAAINMTFWASMDDVADEMRLQQYTVSITK